MDSDPVDERMIGLIRSSPCNSHSSCPSNLTASQEPRRQEADKLQPLPDRCGWWDKQNWMKNNTDTAGIGDTRRVGFRSITENEASVGTSEEFSFWTNSFSDLVHAHKDSDLNWHLRDLVTQAMKDAKAKKHVDLRIHRNQLKARLTEEVAAAPDQLQDAQRILGKVLISMADINCQIGNLEAYKLNQFRSQSPDTNLRGTQRTQLTCAKKQNGAICDFMDTKNCCLDVNEYIVRVTADIRRFNCTVEELKANNTLSDDLVTELKIMASNMEIQIAQLFLRVHALLDASVQVERKLQ